MSSKLEQALVRLEHAVKLLEDAPSHSGSPPSGHEHNDATIAEITAIRGLVDDAMSLIAAQHNTTKYNTKEDGS